MKLFDFISVLILWSLSVVLALTFFAAFFNGGEITVRINSYGEAVSEAIVIPVFIIMGTVTLARMLRKAKGGIR